MISTSPGFNCSIEGTWLASTPISPDSAGMLTCTLRVYLGQLKPSEAHFLVSDGRVTHTSVDLYIDYRKDRTLAL